MKPDFIIGGAPKCATTAVFDYLGQHPQVFASEPKEPHYFASAALGRPVMQSVGSLAEYQALFAGCAKGQLAGEGSTHYLHHAAAVAPLMARRIPDAKLVFCLREPVARAYSHFLFRFTVAGPFTLGGMGQMRNFRAFLENREMFEMGNYAANLRIYRDHFPASQIHLVFFEDILEDPAGCLRDLCRFLDIDEDFAFDLSQRSNETVYPRLPAAMPIVDRLLVPAYERLAIPHRRRLLAVRMKLLFSQDGHKLPIPPEEKAFAKALYADGVRDLEALSRRDLSAWRH